MDQRIKKYWGRIRPDRVFSFILCLPWIDIKTETMCYQYESRAWIYFQVYVKIWKWKFDFKIGRHDDQRPY